MPATPSSHRPSRPLVLVVGITLTHHDKIYSGQNPTYGHALFKHSDVLPVPAFLLSDKEEAKALALEMLANAQGLLLTGSSSNVHPHAYSQEDTLTPDDHDLIRDAVAEVCYRAAFDAGKPILAICRGLQDMNVVSGGTLEQSLARRGAVPAIDHHPKVLGYAKSHAVKLEKGGILHELAGYRDEESVNSVHYQGIKKLGDGLVVEATAPDGTTEAIRALGHRGALGVQWHPEALADEDGFSANIFRLFGDLVYGRRDLRRLPSEQRATLG